MKRWRIYNKVSEQLKAVSAPHFKAACMEAQWRMEDCIGIQLKSTSWYLPPKVYQGGYPHRLAYRSHTRKDI